jgi:hypothetical protein
VNYLILKSNGKIYGTPNLHLASFLDGIYIRCYSIKKDNYGLENPLFHQGFAEIAIRHAKKTRLKDA